ncbi:hypothetical protein HPB47_021693 [Ixodes persulcatus]|uniref:Uncharacterized protein n=1 Tax=Ixodes persulcatus TaxID=34615 RepID=A0AC60QDP6_IXOPE|nr:hypothetical protein HPB47_021693 [Ixodes persulcatus]
MADLEAVLADVSYLMAMEKSKSTPAARASKKIVLPDPRVYCDFLLSVIPEFEKTNVLLQSGAPQIHLLREILHNLLRDLMLRFVKPSVIKGTDVLTDIDYKSFDNQRDDEDMVLGSQTARSLQNLKKEARQELCRMPAPPNRVRSVMHKHLEKMGEVTFDKIFNQKLGYLLFKDFCDNVCDEQVPQLSFYEEFARLNVMCSCLIETVVDTALLGSRDSTLIALDSGRAALLCKRFAA